LSFFQRLGAVRYLLTGLAVTLVAVGATAVVGAVRSDGTSPKNASADLAAAAPTKTPEARPTTARPTPTKTAKPATPKATPTVTKHKTKPKAKPAPAKTKKAEARKVTKKKPVAKRKAVTHKAKPAPKSVTDGKISRTEVISRARTWLGDPSISYNMSGSAEGPDGVWYRSDCSGYASMALHLDAPGRSTIDLPDVTHVLDSKDDLKPGDLLGIMGSDTGGAGGHVMIFVKWNDTSHSSFTVYEHSGNPDQPHKSVYDWPIEDSRGTYLPYRYDNIVN
jgi:cell wall-associated NlpC family hydrolase